MTTDRDQPPPSPPSDYNKTLLIKGGGRDGGEPARFLGDDAKRGIN